MNFLSGSKKDETVEMRIRIRNSPTDGDVQCTKAIGFPLSKAKLLVKVDCYGRVSNKLKEKGGQSLNCE